MATYLGRSRGIRSLRGGQADFQRLNMIPWPTFSHPRRTELLSTGFEQGQALYVDLAAVSQQYAVAAGWDS